MHAVAQVARAAVQACHQAPQPSFAHDGHRDGGHGPHFAQHLQLRVGPGGQRGAGEVERAQRPELLVRQQPGRWRVHIPHRLQALPQAANAMAFSAGFSPHPRISWVGASPTGVSRSWFMTATITCV